ncbi:MAG: hypothetical protein IKE55_05525 [Kiritimatiellae bacterium]|nr:hypothetical protein [Kiritimatiellia bacterium]
MLAFLPGTAPDACVYLGFKPVVTREMWRTTFEAQHGLLDMLHRIPVAPGDFVFVDGGVPHAIGGGCFMVELQEPSDLMVVAERLTPSGRRIPDAKMHGGIGWKNMFDVYEYEALEHEEVCGRYVRRCSQTAIGAIGANGECVSQICGPEFTDKFSMWRIEGQGCLGLPGPACVVVTNGAGAVNGLAANKGDRFLVADEKVIETEGNATLVVCA